MRENELQKRLTIACEIADRARAISLPAFKRAVPAQNKNPGSVFDPVTQADTDTEKNLRQGIEASLPDDGITGEELGQKQAHNRWTWCLDPIDGTRAFVAGVPVWSTLIAVCYDEKPVIGVIDHPALGERYIGTPSQAWRETKAGTTPLKTRKCAALSDALLSCTEPSAMFSDGQKSAYENIRRQSRFTRLGLDAYAYALTATGRLDLVIEAGLEPYDVMALIPVIKGAGGAITNWQGGDAKQGGAIVCAGDPKLLETLYPLLA